MSAEKRWVGCGYPGCSPMCDECDGDDGYWVHEDGSISYPVDLIGGSSAVTCDTSGQVGYVSEFANADPHKYDQED